MFFVHSDEKSILEACVQMLQQLWQNVMCSQLIRTWFYLAISVGKISASLGK